MNLAAHPTLLTQLEKLRNKEHQLALLADNVSVLDRVAALAVLQAVATAKHDEFPQYNQHWNGWRLARCRHAMHLKHNRTFAKPGDYLLVAPKAMVLEGLPNTWSVFSLRTCGDAAWTRTTDYELL
jgi:hypothetical protein